MVEIIKQMLSYPFLVRALVVGSLVALCASLLGVSLVLKRYSMIGDGLSHVGFGAMTVATAFNVAPLSVAIPVVVVASFLLLRLNEKAQIKGDAAVAMISSGALAVGVMIISMTTGMNTDVCNYMFGSILAVSEADATLSKFLSVLVILVYLIFYHRIFAVTFDEVFAKAIGTKANMYNTVLAVLTAITVVLGMRMMGALLISSLIIFPALTAMRICKKYSHVIVLSAVISMVCFFLGIFISFYYSTPTGASVACFQIGCFILACVWNYLKQRLGNHSQLVSENINGKTV